MIYTAGPEIKGLIFDLDGTLVDSMPYHYACWEKACRRYGAYIDKDFLRLHTGSPGWVIAREVINSNNLNGSLLPEEIMNYKMEEFFKVQHNIRIIEPVADIVKRYHGRLPMSIGTGGHREAVDRTLELTGLDKYFTIVVTANDVDNYKPHPETFLKCAEMMGTDPHFTEVFEDGELGIEAARQAGMVVTDVRPWYPATW